jgi:hypothetical protein
LAVENKTAADIFQATDIAALFTASRDETVEKLNTALVSPNQW